MVERSLSMWEVPGSIPGFSSILLEPTCKNVGNQVTKQISYNIRMYNITLHGVKLFSHLVVAKRNIIVQCDSKISEPARIRTWNLLIRSQTRYPLRHRSWCSNKLYYHLKSLLYIESLINIHVHSSGAYIAQTDFIRGISSNGRALA